MIAHLWQSTLFAVAVALLTLAFRNDRAQVRFCLWLSASLKFLFPFALLIGLGTYLGPTPTAQKIATQNVTFVVQYLAEPFPAAPPAPPHTDWRPIALLTLWAAGTLAILIMRLRAWGRIRAILKASQPLDIRSPLEIRSSQGLLEPGVVGIARSVILLPEGIEQRLTPSQLEAVIAHELCHARRRDNLFASIHMVVEALFWFHPLVWWIGARLIDERERACDEAVLALGNQPAAYAEAIVGVCKIYLESPLTCVAGVTGGSIKQRIEAIMENRMRNSLNRTKKLLLAIAAATALIIPITIGLVLGVPHLPAVHAQAPAIPTPALQPVQATPRKPTPETPTKQDHRLIAMLFDLASMTPDQQARARQAAIDYLTSSLKPGDTVAVLSTDNGKVSVAQDFTSDTVLLEAAILRVPVATAGVPAIESAANLLAALPEKKSLLYYSTTAAQAGTPGLQAAIQAAQIANVAIFPINPGAAGPAESPIGRVYLKRFGPPDTVDASEDRQIWRYNYLESFQSKAEFEFTRNSVRINWPPPVATYSSAHGTMQTYPASASQFLSISLASFSGNVVVYGQIQSSGETPKQVAAFWDDYPASSTPRPLSFVLSAGAYRCSFTASEKNTDRAFSEIIEFEVK